MENERLQITLDRSDHTYYAGQVIQGVICLNLTRRTKLKAIKVQISGKGRCKWIEILRKNTTAVQNESLRSIFYSSKEIYCHSDNTLPAFEPRGIELTTGEHKFEFKVPLNLTLPSSFRGSYGFIKYKLRILIQRPWSFDERHTIPVTVIKFLPLLPGFRLNPVPLKKQITKTISLFGTRPISMLALLPADFTVSGETLRICVTVSNNSTTNVEKLRFTILQHIYYYSHVPLRIEKIETKSIATKETGSVQKKSERSFAHELLIPDTAIPTDSDYSTIINISYEVRVEAVLRGFFKNIVLELPFKVYSNCARSNSSELPNSANELDTLTVLRGMANLDTNISSPSHRSQHSESSSLYSVTSDSSTATLSPGLRFDEFSYIPNTSSQLNSPGLAEYVTEEEDGWVPHAPPDIQHSEDREDVEIFNCSSNSSRHLGPPQSNPASRNSTTSTSFLNGRRLPSANELPPSYDELFGTAPNSQHC